MANKEVIWPKIGCGCMLLSSRHPGKALYGLRKGSHGAGMWALPGGKLDLDEQRLEDCIKREIEEEVGITLDIDRIQFVGFSNDPKLDGDINKHFVTMLFKAIIPDDAVPQNLEPHKCEGWEWTSYEQLIEYEETGQLFVPMVHLLEADVVDKNFWRRDVLWQSSAARQFVVNMCQTLYTPMLVSLGLCLIECLLCFAVVKFIGYTEIDWVAYMQEVEGYLSGERNYELLRGDTGPLVYPAGFLYIFSALHWLTDRGANIRLAQWVFAGIYLLNLAVVLQIYLHLRKSYLDWKKATPSWKRLSHNTPSSIPIWALGLLVLSKRVHSLFMLRMFNDCIATMLGYMALYLFMTSKYRLGSLLYSLGVSVKMNMLLWSPGILFVYLLGCGIQETLVCLGICAITQLVLGSPFLSTFPVQYFSKAFELSRVFKYEWTVNLKFLPEEIFLLKPLSIGLLLGTIMALALFGYKWWIALGSQRVGRVLWWGRPEHSLQPSFVAVTILVSNFIGIVFARTLHYQFYSWYFHSIPLLLWHIQVPDAVRVAVWLGIEIAFNFYPATPASSLLLQLCHLIIIVGLYLAPTPAAFSLKNTDKTKVE